MPFAPVLRLLLSLALVVVIGGCGRSPQNAATGRTLLVGNHAEPGDIDPACHDSQQALNIVMALMEGLAQYDAQTCLPIPAVAEHWEVAPDGLAWTFHLRPAARWSNG